eukprot:Protomagalhaensia_wolfi_Nauph_80__337@NODE_1188_length_1667_cov_770_632678_g912_i0_p1_GENE_NODE_1188_length_1667_cov_770_632678_g912_i0NODE_1188_length_1667_cov_770_632678_g912_i0_p1_ORF_typecomplete_len326_score64_53Integrin_beta/PF00362_18/2_7e32VWA/PF00092_28/2_2e08VWA_2/PF13519_6/5_3e06TFA2_Winged_2/PF18121_1/6_5e02TFA2_Winged_2/PF18121_1/1_3e02TFA2_Winged_2/PF18121_1/6_1e02TFA2_Winged_2/PF18121_1/13_NODE_1188_length_1667_cov_770_632678_g912_i06101587
MRLYSLVILGLLGEGVSARCKIPLDLLFLQDTSGSFDDDLPGIMKALDALNEKMQDRFSAVRLGVAEFRDKPYYPLGMDDDFCYKLQATLTDSFPDFKEAYSSLQASGGGDNPEATLQAIISSLFDPRVAWRNEEPALSIIALITDAMPHLPNDVGKLSFADYPGLPRHLKTNSGSIKDPNDLNYECVYEDYPSHVQVSTALKQKSTILLILTPDSDKEVVSAWKWFNDFLGQPSEYYMHIREDSSDLEQVLPSMLSRVRASCVTPPPSNIVTCEIGKNCQAPCCADDDGILITLKDIPAGFTLDINNETGSMGGETSDEAAEAD